MNGVLRGLFALYVLTIIFILLSMLVSIVALLVSTPVLMVANLVISSLAILSSSIASIVVTVALTRGVNALNDVGKHVGIYGERGGGFLVILPAFVGENEVQRRCHN